MARALGRAPRDAHPAPRRAAAPRRLPLPQRAPTADAGPRRRARLVEHAAAARQRARPARRPGAGVLERSVRTRAFALARWPMLRVPGADLAADSIETHLAECFGAPVRVGVMLGTRRVNQKPVLQVFDLAGRLLGYAKVGHNDLTAALVRREADALTLVGDLGPTSFRVPRMLHHGRWNDLEVLVISALPTDARHPVLPAARLAAMHEVVRLAGTTRSTLATSSFWDRHGPEPRRAGPRALGTAAAGRRRRHRATRRRRGGRAGWLARRLGPLEHGHGRRGAAGVGLGALRPGRAGGLRRPPLHRAGRAPGRAGPPPPGGGLPAGGPRHAHAGGCRPGPARPDPPALPAGDLARATWRRSRTAPPPRCNDVLPGPSRCWSAPRTSTPHLREDDHEHPHRRTPPRQDPGPGGLGPGGLRHLRAAPAPVVRARRGAARRDHVLLPGAAVAPAHPLRQLPQGRQLLRRQLRQGRGLVPGPLPHRVVPPAAHPRRGGRPGHVRGQRLLHVPPPGRRADGPGPAGRPHPDDAARPGRAGLLGLEARAGPGVRDRVLRECPRPGGGTAGRRGGADVRRRRLPERAPPPPGLPPARPVRRPAAPDARGHPRRPDPRDRERVVLRAARDDVRRGARLPGAAPGDARPLRPVERAAQLPDAGRHPRAAARALRAPRPQPWPGCSDGSPHGCPETRGGAPALVRPHRVRPPAPRCGSCALMVLGPARRAHLVADPARAPGPRPRRSRSPRCPSTSCPPAPVSPRPRSASTPTPSCSAARRCWGPSPTSWASTRARPATASPSRRRPTATSSTSASRRPRRRRPPRRPTPPRRRSCACVATPSAPCAPTSSGCCGSGSPARRTSSRRSSATAWSSRRPTRSSRWSRSSVPVSRSSRRRASPRPR